MLKSSGAAGSAWNKYWSVHELLKTIHNDLNRLDIHEIGEIPHAQDLLGRVMAVWAFDHPSTSYKQGNGISTLDDSHSLRHPRLGPQLLLAAGARTGSLRAMVISLLVCAFWAWLLQACTSCWRCSS
jgi:hypothetical protein